MKYIATTNLSGSGVRQGEQIEAKSLQQGFAPVRRVEKDRSKPKLTPKITFWQRILNAFS